MELWLGVGSFHESRGGARTGLFKMIIRLLSYILVLMGAPAFADSNCAAGGSGRSCGPRDPVHTPLHFSSVGRGRHEPAVKCGASGVSPCSYAAGTLVRPAWNDGSLDASPAEVCGWPFVRSHAYATLLLTHLQRNSRARPISHCPLT